MPSNENHAPVVAGEAVEPASAERGIPQVGRKGKVNKPLIAFLMVVAVLAVLCLAARAVIGQLADKRSTKHLATQDAASIPALTQKAFRITQTKPPAPPNARTTVTTAGVGGAFVRGAGKLTPQQQAAADLLARRQRSPLLAVHGGGGRESVGKAGGENLQRRAADNGFGSLGQALRATREAPVAASLLANPNLTITQGTFIDCVLETALDSEEPGMTRCVLSRNVYSTNGRVLLLPRGSRLVGEYQSGQLHQGQQRLFVVWTRVETPAGVIINLDAPSTDDLGRSGMNGRVDNHFLARFGAAFLVSVVNDLTNYAIATESQGQSTQLNFNTTTGEVNNLASIIAQHSINMPPKLYKNQGGHIGVFVARDLYFGNVYGLRAIAHHAD